MMKLGKITALGGAALFGAAAISGWFNIQSAQHQSRSILSLNQATELMRGHMYADMMHDAVRSDVLAALAATEPNSPLSMSDVQNDLKEHLSALQDRVARDQQFKDDPAVVAAASQLAEPVAAYIDGAQQIAELASTDPQGAKARLPQFFDMFHALEGKMEATSEAISQHALAQRNQSNMVNAAAARISWATMAILLVLVTCLGAAIHRMIVRPVVNVAECVRQITIGNFDIIVTDSKRNDEIGDLQNAVSALREQAEEVERMREEMNGSERQQRQDAINRLSHSLDQVAEGSLVATINEPFPEVYEQLRHNFNATLVKLSTTIHDVARSAEGVRTGSGEIRGASSDLASRTERQASTLEHAASALTQTSASVQQTARNAAEVNRSVDTAHTSAKTGGEIVGNAIEAMSAIEKSSTEIHSIIDLIESITFQTNLLALNASVEAARAGDAGRGFAVVANEVRALAQRSASAASSIKQLIENSRTQVTRGVALVNDSGESLREIMTQVDSIRDVIAHIASAVDEQANGLTVISETVSDMDRMTQQNAAMVEQSAAASQELASEADRLASLVEQFTLPDTFSRAA